MKLEDTQKSEMQDLPVTVHKSPYEGAEVGEYTEVFHASPLSAQRFAKHIIAKGGKARIGKRGQDHYVYHTGAGPISKRDWRMSEAANHQDYKVRLNDMKEESNMSSSEQAQTWAVMPRNPKHYMKYFPLNREEEARTFAKNSKGTLMLLDKMGKKIPIKESKSASLPSMVSSTENFNLMCSGDDFVLRSGGKRIAKMSHGDWQHIADAVKNRTTVTVKDYVLNQKGDSYALSDTAGKELSVISAGEMDKLIDDAKKYLENTKVVEEKSILKIAEMRLNPNKEYANFDSWKKAVMAHYPEIASKLKWNGRIESGKSTISAEVPGKDRSYGVWYTDKNIGVILGESKMKISELFDASIDAGEYDQEGDMAKIQLRTILDASQELHDMLDDDENLPEWVQSKLTLAQDYVVTVRDYLKAKHQ